MTVLCQGVRGGRSSPQVNAGSMTIASGADVGVVAIVERKILLRIANPIAEHRVGPRQVAADGLGIRIEEELVGIEAMALLGHVRPVHAIAVELAGRDVGQIAVPDLIGVFRHQDAMRRPRLPTWSEQTEFHARCMLGEEGEVDPAAVPRRPQRIGSPRPYSHIDSPSAVFYAWAEGKPSKRIGFGAEQIGADPRLPTSVRRTAAYTMRFASSTWTIFGCSRRASS